MDVEMMIVVWNEMIKIIKHYFSIIFNIVDFFIYFLQWDQPSMVIIVYDVTSETSFSSCEKWLERVKSKKPGTPLLGLF